MAAFPAATSFPFADPYNCLDSRLADALAIEDENSRRAALQSCLTFPRPGNGHVFTVPLLRCEVCSDLRRSVLASNEPLDNYRAGAGRNIGELHSAANRARERWVYRTKWTEWLYSMVLSPLISSAFQGAVLLDAFTAESCSHHSYVLNYRKAAVGPHESEPSVDTTSLGFHTDDADFTVNISLGPVETSVSPGAEANKNAWGGGDLLFCDDPSGSTTRPGTPDQVEEARAGRLWKHVHECGTAVVHDGTAYHAAESISHGERTQLIYWCMKNDAKWKESFYSEMESELLLREKQRNSGDGETTAATGAARDLKR